MCTGVVRGGLCAGGRAGLRMGPRPTVNRRCLRVKKREENLRGVQIEVQRGRIKRMSGDKAPADLLESAA